jgi:hypothetical protein
LTVIAFKDGVMAADTLASDGQSRLRVQKIVRLPDGGVAGMCGNAADGYAGLSWLASGGSQEGTEGKQLVPDISDATILIARPDGSLWLLEGRFPAFPLLDKIAAEGCGAAAARVAMGLGLSAVEAVMQVAQHDIFCGDPVQSLAVEPTHEYGGVKTYVPAPAKRRAPAKKKARRK